MKRIKKHSRKFKEATPINWFVLNLGNNMFWQKPSFFYFQKLEIYFHLKTLIRLQFIKSTMTRLKFK